jgi:hypothetical protein
LLGIAFAAWLAIMTVTLKAIYDSEAVDIRCAILLPPSLWARQTGRMLRSDIAAKRKFSIFGFMPTYVLHPKERTKKKLAIWGPKEADYFRNWISGIPDRPLFWNRRKSNRKP